MIQVVQEEQPFLEAPSVQVLLLRQVLPSVRDLLGHRVVPYLLLVLVDQEEQVYQGVQLVQEVQEVRQLLAHPSYQDVRTFQEDLRYQVAREVQEGRWVQGLLVVVEVEVAQGKRLGIRNQRKQSEVDSTAWRLKKSHNKTKLWLNR